MDNSFENGHYLHTDEHDGGKEAKEDDDDDLKPEKEREKNRTHSLTHTKQSHRRTRKTKKERNQTHIFYMRLKFFCCFDTATDGEIRPYCPNDYIIHFLCRRRRRRWCCC